MEKRIQSHEQMIKTVVASRLGCVPTFVKRITIGICNEVYEVGLENKSVIARLSPYNRFLMGSHDHIPKFRALKIKAPDILAEDYSRAQIPLAYQIQSKIEGQNLGAVIETLTDNQLKALAKEIATIFNKLKTIPTDGKFGVIWGGGDNDVCNTWTEWIRLWINKSIEHGKQTGILNENIARLAEHLYTHYKPYFESVKAVTYYDDISSKNVMIHNGVFNGLVDLDGLTQGDPLEAVGRIKLSWYGTHYGEFYTNAVMDELGLTQDQRKFVTMYALLNQISWTCENGIQFNQNTQPTVNKEKEQNDKALVKIIAAELQKK